jgi:hypothetical protein
MISARFILQLGAAAAVALGVAVLAPGESAAGPPALRLPPRLSPAEVRIPKTAVQAAIEKATGPVASECKGAQAALQAYTACKDRCATAAQTAPITPLELEKCGNMSAEDCAEQLISSRAQACINAPSPAGCKDEFAKLQVENAECKSCNELKSATEKAVDATKAQAKVVAQAEAALAQARAQLAAAEARASALAAKTARTCADAQK